jgi:hypothetical protein
VKQRVHHKKYTCILDEPAPANSKKPYTVDNYSSLTPELDNINASITPEPDNLNASITLTITLEDTT